MKPRPEPEPLSADDGRVRRGVRSREAIVAALMAELSRGVSYWDAVGGFTGEKRTIIVCTIYRPQVNDLKRIIARLDPSAFITIGVTQEALGKGFGDLSMRE